MTENESTESVQAERGDRFLVRNIRLDQQAPVESQAPEELRKPLRAAIESVNQVIAELQKYETTLCLINSSTGFTDYNIIENKSARSVQAGRGDRFLVTNIRLGQQAPVELQAPVEFRRRLGTVIESFNQIIAELHKHKIKMYFINSSVDFIDICLTIPRPECEGMRPTWDVRSIAEADGPCATDGGDACCEMRSLAGGKYKNWSKIE